MKKFECPHCGEKTINPLQKAFAGNQKSKGVVCPNCGKRCTNDMKSTYFHTVVDLLMLIAVVAIYFIAPAGQNFFYMLIPIISAFVINKIADAFFFSLAPSMRID